MKKLLVILAIVSVLFISCSSNDDFDEKVVDINGHYEGFINGADKPSTKIFIDISLASIEAITFPTCSCYPDIHNIEVSQSGQFNVRQGDFYFVGSIFGTEIRGTIEFTDKSSNIIFGDFWASKQ